MPNLLYFRPLKCLGPQKRCLKKKKTGTARACKVSACVVDTQSLTHVQQTYTHTQKCDGNSRRDDMLNYPGDVWLNEPLVLITLRINQQP